MLAPISISDPHIFESMERYGPRQCLLKKLLNSIWHIVLLCPLVCNEKIDMACRWKPIVVLGKLTSSGFFHSVIPLPLIHDLSTCLHYSNRGHDMLDQYLILYTILMNTEYQTSSGTHPAHLPASS
ncbi:hypothetical protein KCU79_g11, partial [Aureobasidium melanogenum]